MDIICAVKANSYGLRALNISKYLYSKKLNDLPGIVKCHIKIDICMNRFGHKVKDIEIIKKILEQKI